MESIQLESTTNGFEISETNDVDEESWTELYVAGIVPTPRHCNSTVVHNDSLFIFGGYSNDGKAGVHRNDLFEFELNTRTWKSVYCHGEAPVVRHSHTAVVYENFMYVFGGIATGGQSLNDLYRLELTNKKWEKVEGKGNPPSPRWGHTANIVDSSFYVFGGYGQSFLHDLYEFHFPTQSWSKVMCIGNAPKPRQFHASAVYKNYIFIIGGFAAANYNEMYMFDTVLKKWSLVNQDKLCQRRGHTAVVYKDGLYVFGGNDRLQMNDLIHWDFEKKVWTTMPADEYVPRPRHFHSAVIYKESMYIFGGFTRKLNMNDVHRYRFERSEETISTRSLSTDLKRLVNNPRFSDIQFTIDDQIIYAHKNILCTRNEHFAALISNGMKESNQDVIKLTNIKFSVFLSILEYLYTDKSSVMPDDAVDLLIAADHMLIPGLKTLTEKNID